MGIDRSNFSLWVSENRDPSAEAVYEICLALEKINREAAEEFVRLDLLQKSIFSCRGVAFAP